MPEALPDVHFRFIGSHFPNVPYKVGEEFQQIGGSLPAQAPIDDRDVHSVLWTKEQAKQHEWKARSYTYSVSGTLILFSQLGFGDPQPGTIPFSFSGIRNRAPRNGYQPHVPPRDNWSDNVPTTPDFRGTGEGYTEFEPIPLDPWYGMEPGTMDYNISRWQSIGSQTSPIHPDREAFLMMRIVLNRNIFELGEDDFRKWFTIDLGDTTEFGGVGCVVDSTMEGDSVGNVNAFGSSRALKRAQHGLAISEIQSVTASFGVASEFPNIL